MAAFFGELDVDKLNLRGASSGDALSGIRGKADLLAALGLGSSGDAVYVQAAVVAAPAALTSAAITGGESPTEAEHNALQADVAALRTTVAAILTSLKGSGKPMAAS